MSQMDVALDAGVSTRHLSFVETGRARPSAEMILRLSEPLDVPFRDRNVLLLAAGHAPIYEQRPLEDPAMGPVRDVLDQVLRGHEPYPAVVVDRHWGMVAANAGIAALTAGVDPVLLEPPVNVLRLSLHPDGMAGRIVNLEQWRAHLLERLARQAVTSGDPALAALREELAAYPGGTAVSDDRGEAGPATSIAVPLRLRQGDRVLSFISTVTTFDTATDVTVAELAIEAFYPADAATAAVLRGTGGSPNVT
jgi:transcriptional regulator with XRE-family HTH domain